MTRLLIVVSLAASSAVAIPLGCTGSATLGTFQLSVRPFSRGAPLSLKSVASVPAGSRLIWNPVHLIPQASGSAEISAVLVPASGGKLITLEPRKASTRTEWQLLERPQVIALIFGPQGLNEDKIKSLVTRNTDLLRQLAEYAEESSQVESLVQQLADAEQAGSSADGALKGISSQYGVSVQKLDPKASSNQQAGMLLKMMLPASGTYDPLATSSAQAQQSAGLAASVAGIFFGSGVGLAAGGAALFQNLKTVLFPNTEFRSAFEQSAGKDQMAFCTKSLSTKSKTRTAYLWAYSVPQLEKPVLSLAGEPHLPFGAKSTILLKAADGSPVKGLERAREWRLTPISSGSPIPVEGRPSGAASLEIDLAKAHVNPGDYRLAGTWDWDSLPVSGTLHLHPMGDFSRVSVARADRDKLIEGNANLSIELSGSDFEFLEKVALESSARDAKPAEIGFTLPLGKREGPQNSVTLHFDAAKQGSYRLLLTQADGVAHAVPLTILPPNPKISDLPIRINMGERRQPIHLEGSGLDRIEAITSDAGEIAGAPDARGWSGQIVPKSSLIAGQSFPLLLKVKGIENPLDVRNAIDIVGPRPRIVSVQKSLASVPAIEIRADELPAGIAAGLELTVNHLNDAVPPRLELDCATGDLRHPVSLAPGEPSSTARLTLAGPRALYLSVDPGAIGHAGCRLTATVVLDPEGRSEPFVLGRVIRAPSLDRFTLTSEKLGDSSYAGILEGRDLDVIEMAGWDAEHGLPVNSIPTPLPGDPSRQMLRIVLPWPSPAPHSPLYIWLRGEAQGRKTAISY